MGVGEVPQVGVLSVNEDNVDIFKVTYSHDPLIWNEIVDPFDDVERIIYRVWLDLMLGDAHPHCLLNHNIIWIYSNYSDFGIQF